MLDTVVFYYSVQYSCKMNILHRNIGGGITRKAPMPQSKTMSLLESFANVGIGLGVSLISQLVIFKAYGIHISLGQNIEITAWFTLISIVRSFYVRRLFNRIHHKKEEQK